MLCHYKDSTVTPSQQRCSLLLHRPGVLFVAEWDFQKTFGGKDVDR